MEFVDGSDLEKRLGNDRRLLWPAAVDIAIQMARALREAHALGYLHRDVKPGNILLYADGRARLTDFGIVKELQGEPGDPGLTNADAIQGTPAFLAPEQALGTMELDGRCDIYAAGCLAYWLLTAQHVFTADTPVALLVHHVQTNPVPPSARTELAIPAALDEIILACLAKDPAERPQTARELADRLGTVELNPGWTEERARGWWALHHPADV